MNKRALDSKAATMIIPKGTEIGVDVHGQLNIRTPGNLVIETSGNYGVIESLRGSIRIEPQAEVEAVQVQCADVCYVQGSLTAWKVSAHSLQLEEKARANIVLQETEQLEIGRGARLVGNFSSEKEMFLLFSRFAEQLRALPLFARRSGSPPEVESADEAEIFLEAEGAVVEPEAIAVSESEHQDTELDDPLFFALILLEREFARSAYGPTSQRVIEELIKMLQERDLEALRLTFKTLCGRVVEPGRDVRRACELLREHFSS